ncbi:MAG: GGDEF domain-containing protein [Gallionellaceae bacterium]|nr:GGDEF domain-containing protein [Gallionellaceae bacterium]
MKKVFDKVNFVLDKCSRTQISLISMAFVAFIALIDIVVGYEIAISIFFLIPIVISTWYGSHRAGITCSILSAIIWFVIDYTGHPYTNPAGPYWNATVRLGFFLIIEGLLTQLKIRFNIEQYLSRTDKLTNLLNVRGFTEQAEKLFSLAFRYKRPVVLAYIDLDDFKKINDGLGHGEGDKVLQIVGARILISLRAADVAGRLGGDEFAIVLPETDVAGAKAMFDSLRGALLEEMQKHNWLISFSIGVVSFDAPACNLKQAIALADSLMYQVKARGKNSIIFQHNRAM